MHISFVNRSVPMKLRNSKHTYGDIDMEVHGPSFGISWMIRVYLLKWSSVFTQVVHPIHILGKLVDT